MSECIFCLAEEIIMFNLHEYPAADKPRRFVLCEEHLKKLRYFLYGD